MNTLESAYDLFNLLKVKVKVPVYSLISTHMHVQPTLYPPGTVLPQGRTRTINPTLDSCTRYPSLLGGQESGRNFLGNTLNTLGFKLATPELDDQRLRPLSHHSTKERGELESIQKLDYPGYLARDDRIVD